MAPPDRSAAPGSGAGSGPYGRDREPGARRGRLTAVKLSRTDAFARLGTALRLGLAAVWVVAGAAKLGDLAGSVRAVAAYQITPYEAAAVVGSALPFVELARGALPVRIWRPGTRLSVDSWLAGTR